MAGVEAVIGAVFVSAVMKEVVKTGHSYCAGKYKEHKDTQEMLYNLEASLPRILSAIRSAERKTSTMQDEDVILKEWLRQLKDVAYEAEDVMDDFEAKRIRDGLKKKGKVSEIATSSARAVKSWFMSDKEEKKLKNLIKKIKIICDGIGEFSKMIETGNNNAIDGFNNSSTRETSCVLPKNKKIFGREKEIELVLDMIIGYRETQSYVSNYGFESQEDAIKEGTDQISDVVGEHDAPQISLENPCLIENETGHEDPLPFKEMPSPSQDTHKSLVSENEEVVQTKSIHHGSSSPSISDLAQSSKEKIVSSMTLSHRMRYYQIMSSISVGNKVIGVLPIVGIGGVGKTTIAQVIYNHPRVKEEFDLQGWVYVVNSNNHVRTIHDILCSYNAGSSKSNATITSLNDGHLQLKNAIYEKKFLLIFDDVREGRAGLDSTWHKLLEVLADGAAGSIVLLTTESKSIANTIGKLPPIFLDVLQWDNFLALFEYYAFGHIKYRNETENQYFPLTYYEETVFKPIGEQIAKKLGGLPLAAEAVGTLLRIKPDKSNWEKILQSNWWDLENASDKILLSLGDSFQNLDPDLKQCFLYCSLFPRNYVFDRNRLVQTWMAHGFIHPTEAENIKLETNELKMEDIGRSKFDKLVDSFFFQTTVLENRYVMNSLIRELAIATSSEMLYVSSNYLIGKKTIPSSVRHLAIDSNIEDDAYVDDIKWSNKNIQSLRTMMFFGFCKMRKGKGLQSILDKLCGLRLLDLSYFIKSPIVLLDSIIGQLSHLRFLDISFSGITEVPKSLCQLVHLQVLDMRGCQFSKLPDEMNKLINLRHLYASSCTISLIRGIGSLTNLQELEEFSVKKSESFTITELKDLNSLQGQLIIKHLNEVPSREMAKTAVLEEKTRLTSLILDMGPIYYKQYAKHVKVLEGLKPHNNIQELTIFGTLSNSFPSWIMEMNDLQSITITSCLYVESLPPLGSLPKLEVLILEDLESIICIGEESYGSSHVIFPSLKELVFSKLLKWERWMDTGGRQLFPYLEKLKITDCSKLSGAPLHYLSSSVGALYLSLCDKVTKDIGRYLANMTSLRELYLRLLQFEKIDLCCDFLGDLQVLTLRNLGISPHCEGQLSSLASKFKKV